MLRSTATVPTARAARYRDQLARHGAGMLRQFHQRDHAGGPPIHDATVADGKVVLDLAWGRCTITAAADALLLVAEAETPENLARIQSGVGQRVTKIGRRDGLAVTWSPTDGEAPSDDSPGSAVERHGAALGATGIIAIVGIIGVVHLGVGAALLRQQWA